MASNKEAIDKNKEKSPEPMSKPMKIAVTVLISVPQAYLIWADKDWQVNLITLLATISILIFWNFDKIGELTIKKDEISLKIRQAVNEMYASLDSVKEIAAPLFIQGVENQMFKGYFFYDEVESTVKNFDKNYRGNAEIEDTMKTLKYRAIKKYLTDIDNSAPIKASIYTDKQIRNILPKLVEKWKEKYGDGTKPSHTYYPETKLNKYEHVIEAKDNVEKLLDLFQQYDI